MKMLLHGPFGDYLLVTGGKLDVYLGEVDGDGSYSHIQGLCMPLDFLDELHFEFMGMAYTLPINSFEVL